MKLAAVVTGASVAGGIGEAIAKRFARIGASILLVAEDGSASLGEIKRICEALQPEGGGSVDYCVLDLALRGSAEHMIDEAIRRMGCIDVLVNNAAIRCEVPLGSITREQFDAILAVNLAAPLFASQAAIPYMEREGGGRIINIASQFGRVTYKGRALYGMSKAALIHLTKSMAFELAPKGITVNAVSPGPIQTARTEERRVKDPEEVARQIRALPVGRLGEPDEIAEVVHFLATTSATFLTGEDICIDGGYTIH